MATLLFEILLVIHIIGVTMGVGATNVADYFHIKGMFDHKLEKKLMHTHERITEMIYIGLFVLLLTGSAMLYLRPGLLSSSLFQLKLALVAIVFLNGQILVNKVSPRIRKDIKKGHPVEDDKSIDIISSTFGTISIVTWYSILILSLTKGLGYTVSQFVLVYVSVLILAFIGAYIFHRKTYHKDESIFEGITHIKFD